MPVEQARKHVRRYFMQPLAKAPFSTREDAIVSGVGPCETCPHNTRTQTILFRDIEPEQAFCVNIPCYEQKADAAWARRSEQARANGEDILSEQDARQVWPFPYSEYVSTNAPYVPLSASSQEFEPPKTYAELVQICEGVGEHVSRALARRPGGHEIVELITASDARAVVALARSTLRAIESASNAANATTQGADAPAATAPSPTGEPDASREERWKQLQDEATRNKREQTQQHRAAMGVFIHAFHEATEDAAQSAVRIVAKRFVQNCLVETLREVVTRRGLKSSGNVQKDRGMRAEPEAALLAWLDRTDDDMSVSALILELVLTKDATTTSDAFSGLRDVLAALGIREEDARQGRAKPEGKKPATGKAPRKRPAQPRAKARAEA